MNKGIFDGFTVNIFTDAEGYYQGHLMEFPSISAFGLTPAETFRQLEKAWKLMKEGLREREKQHTAFVLDFFKDEEKVYERSRPPQIEALSEQALSDVFCDETSSLKIKYRAALILLVLKKSTKFAPICLEFLKLMVNKEVDKKDFEKWLDVVGFADLLLDLSIIEAYQEIKDFIHYLLTENPRHRNFFIDLAVLSLTNRILLSNKREVIPILKSIMSHFQCFSSNHLMWMAECFDKFQDTVGIKDILTNHLTDEMPDVETQCLALLQKHDPDFVKQWKLKKESANTQNEKSS